MKIPYCSKDLFQGLGILNAFARNCIGYRALEGLCNGEQALLCGWSDSMGGDIDDAE